MAEFSERLKSAIAASGLRPADISRKTGISQAALSHYLKGHYKPGSKKLKLLSEVLKVSDAWLDGYDMPEQKVVTDGIAKDDINNVVIFHRNGERIEKRLSDDQIKMVIAMLEAVPGDEKD